MPITKHNYIVKDINDLQRIVKEAFYIAKEGRPGPVLIDIPKDITAAKAKYEKIIPKEVEKRVKHITNEALETVAKLINEAENPFIYAGGGVIASAAYEELIELVEKINSPVATSLMAMSSIPYDHPLYTGMIGMHGSKASNLLVSKCDLLITLGARFSDRVISNQNHIKNAKIIQIDVDPAEINKNVKVDSFIVGDLKIVLQKLIPLLQEKKNESWINKMNEFKNLSNKNNNNEGGELTPEFLFKALSDLDNNNFVISTEVGQHQMWAAQYFKFKRPRTFISSGGLGTMGFGLGASIGAQMALKDKRVINIAGDGSFGMNCNELVTAAKNNLPIIVIILNNNSLGMVRQWQNFFYEGRYSSTTLNRSTDFVKLSEAFGGKGYRVYEKEELLPVLKKALEYKGPVVIDYVIHNDKKVFPMVAPGAPINEIIEEDV